MSEKTIPAAKVWTKAEQETTAIQGSYEIKGLSVPPPRKDLMQEGATAPKLTPQAGISSGQGSGSNPQTSSPSPQPTTPSVDSSNGG